MADRGRDLKVSILSDVEKFDLDKPAEELESLGREAKTTAEKVDDAFDKIAKSSRSNLRKVDSELDRAGKGLDDFKDEAADSGREAAASFTGGFDDITDLVQEIGANAFAKLGKAGMLAGGALAAALGFVVSKAQEAKERISELEQQYFEFLKADPGENTPAKRLQEFVDSLDVDTLKDYGDALKATGIDSETFARALSGDKAAIDELLPVLDKMVGNFQMPWDEKAMEAQHLGNVLRDVEKGTAGANAAAETRNALLGDVAAKEQAAAEAAERHKAALETQAAQSQTTADSIKGVGDAWSETTEAAEQSLSDLNEINQKRLDAMKAHKENLMLIAQEESDEFLEFMKSRPAEEVAAYVKGTEAEKAKYRAIWNQVGAVSMEGAAAGMISNKQKVVDAAAGIYRAASDEFGNPIIIGTKIKPPAPGEADRVRRLIANAIGDVPVNMIPKYGNQRYSP